MWRYLLLMLALPLPTAARTLEVGANHPLPTPSAAARVAQDGDTILIDPGTYYDCSIWRQNGLIIAGAGPHVVITDTTCQGKAIIIIAGRDTTIRDLTLARARVPDLNGAGIRLEAPGLTLRHVTFSNNQVGLLGGGSDDGTVDIADCQFEDGGNGGDHPTFAVQVGAVRRLRITDSHFMNIKGGQITSAADRTELIGNTIATGFGADPASAVVGTGGDLLIENNQFTTGPNPPRRNAMIVAMGSGTPTLRRNGLTNTTGQPLALLLNWSGRAPELSDNRIGPGDTERSIEGLARHRASVLVRSLMTDMRHVLGTPRRIMELIRAWWG